MENLTFSFCFSELVGLTHAKDKTRPVTFVTSQSIENDKAVSFFIRLIKPFFILNYRWRNHNDLFQKFYYYIRLILDYFSVIYLITLKIIIENFQLDICFFLMCGL